MGTVLRILYDNEAVVDALEAGWGFSCLVERDGRMVLFDTGWDGDLLLRNASALGVDLTALDAIVISHDHWDHIGGLPRVLQQVKRTRVLLPSSTSRRMREEVALRSDLVEVGGPVEVVAGISTTGVMRGGPGEQSLLIDLDDGVGIMTGCAHQGLGAVLDLVEGRGRKVSAVVGGLHGFDRLDRLAGIGRIYACHCTVHKNDILSRYPDRALACGAGSVIEL